MTRASVDRIVHAAAQAGAARAREYAEWAVRETGFGVAEHKVLKNLASSTGLAEAYAGHDYVTPRIDPAAKIVEIPRPAGVVLALTPSTNPVATVFVKVAAGPDDPQRGGGQPAPAGPGVLGRRGPRAGRRGGRGGRPGRRHPGGGRAVGAADQRADGRRADQRDRGHRRDRRGPRRVQLGQPGHRGRPGQRAGAGRRAPRTWRRRRSGSRTARASTTRSCAPTSRC